MLTTSKAWIKRRITFLGYILGFSYALVINALFFGENYFSNGWVFLLATVSTSLFGLLLGMLHNLEPVRVSQFWGPNRNRLLQIVVTLFFFSLTAVFTLGIFFFYKITSFPGFLHDSSSIKWALLAGFVADLLGIGFGLARNNLLALKQAELEKEKLAKLQLQNELDILKNQVNPHFLFNSLNVLSGLISEDQVQAEKFVDQLSLVYRYVLQSNRKEWATIDEELSFIRSYSSLLQTRFGESLSLKIEAGEDDLQKRIPPLSLQLLIENAVKHNIVSRQKPLHILVSCAYDVLSVCNNLQRKKAGEVLSHGVGLSNILEKYRLMNNSTIEVIEEGGKFCVRLPLIAPE